MLDKKFASSAPLTNRPNKLTKLKNMFDVITIGSATRDVFLISKSFHPHESTDAITNLEACFPFGAKINVEKINFDTGGGATNNAATFSRLGKLKVATVCRVGNDSSGRDIIEILKKEKIDRSFVQVAKDEPTAYATILSPGSDVGERTILVYRGASKKIEHEKIPWWRCGAKWFYISSLGGDISLLQKIISHAKKIKAKIALNPGGEEIKQAQKNKSLFRDIDFLILNREEAANLTTIDFHNTKELLRSLHKFSNSVIMTDGAKGAYAIQKDLMTFYVPSVGHKPKNITGAGDAFGSGFIVGWIKSKDDIIEALQVGSINADSVVQHVGAKIGILDRYPTKQQLRKLMIKKLNLKS